MEKVFADPVAGQVQPARALTLSTSSYIPLYQNRRPTPSSEYGAQLFRSISMTVFVIQRSTASNLLVFFFNSGQDVHAIYADFSEAFDIVDHNLFIYKLSLLNSGRQ